MVPKDLSGFSVEQLRGFETAVTNEINELRAEAKGDAEKLASLERLLDERDAVTAAISLAVEAEAAELEVDEAVNGDDSEGTEPVEEVVIDAEQVLEEAVASAAMGGGTAPRISVNEGSRASGSDIRKFVRNMVNGSVNHEERHSFSTIRRETNHVVREGQNATEAMGNALRDRLAGKDKKAAGCFCGPDDAITAIKTSGETVRPVSDTLPTLTASGDIRYVRQIDLTDALTGVTEWTCADQDDVDPEVVSTWKPCFELACEPEQTSAMYAVSACASFSTQQLIGNPTLVDNLQHVMEVAYNKTAELLVYNRLRALSSKYDFGLYPTSGYGASAQLFAAVGWAMELIQANFRESNPNYTIVLPAGLISRVLTDGQIRADEDYVDRSEIISRLNALGIGTVVEAVDEITGVPTPLAHATPADPAAARAAAVAQPTIQELQLYRPEDFVLGVAPELNLGVTRSPELARQNKLQWFTESFEFVEKVGVAPAVNLTVPFCASGIRPAYGEGIDCVVQGG